MVYFRELNNTFFDGTDYYFANYVELDKSSLANFKLCERELNGYRWVDLKKTEEFMSTHQVRNTQKYLLTYLAELYQSGKLIAIQDLTSRTLCQTSTGSSTSSSARRLKSSRSTD